MSIINLYKVNSPKIPNHILKKQKEATYIFKLWYPRPMASVDCKNDPVIKARITKLLDCGYGAGELEVWFRLKNGRGATRTLEANKIWEDIKAVYHFKCAYCGVKDDNLTKDHIIPISKGGRDSMYNIVPACGSCNSKKNARLLLDWDKFKALQLHLLGFS
jgi:hypothetical protein